jgi:hypothetical protein
MASPSFLSTTRGQQVSMANRARASDTKWARRDAAMDRSALPDVRSSTSAPPEPAAAGRPTPDDSVGACAAMDRVGPRRPPAPRNRASRRSPGARAAGAVSAAGNPLEDPSIRIETHPNRPHGEREGDRIGSCRTSKPGAYAPGGGARPASIGAGSTACAAATAGGAAGGTSTVAIVRVRLASRRHVPRMSSSLPVDLRVGSASECHPTHLKRRGVPSRARVVQLCFTTTGQWIRPSHRCRQPGARAA